MVTKTVVPPKLVAVVGLTASGKTALGIQLAQRFNGEIICADSRTIYREMNIGTAKPTAEEQAAVPHHLLDVMDPGQPFSAVDFKALAVDKIKEIASHDKLPIMVGGTGLYVDSVIFDYKFTSKGKSSERENLEKYSIDELKVLLEQKSIPVPQNEKNKRYLIRALEREGMPADDRKQLRPNTLIIGLQPSKGVLRKRIEARAQAMLQAGILDEVRYLGEKYGWQSEAMTGNVYPIFRGVIEGKKRVGEALQEFVKSDLYLAKRQRTWFKRNPCIQWVDSSDEAFALVDAFLRQ